MASNRFPALSGGSLLKICQGATNVDKPILQLVSTKKIAGTSTERYRLLISDGQFCNSYGMLATQLNPMLHDDTLTDLSIIRVNKLQCNNMQGKKVIILLELEVLHSGQEVGEKLGSPISIAADGTLPPGTVVPKDENRPVNVADKRGADEAGFNKDRQPMAKKKPSMLNDNFNSSSSSNIASSSVFPIASLTPYQNKWTIKARVTHKGDIRRWSNARGEGHLFSMDLVDESGEIRATAFKEMCDKYYNSTEVGKVYFINNCSLKPANKQYSTLNNDYELTFRDSTEMVLCEEDTSDIPSVTFNFCQLSQLTPGHKDQIIDVLGVCKSAGEVATITSQRTGKELRKCDLVLVDKSLAEINLTLWGSNAENFEGGSNPVLAVKGCKVSDYNGVSLSALGSSTIQINPDMPEAFALKGWYESEGSTATFSSLTTARGPGAGGDLSGGNLKTLGEVKAENLGLNSERGEYYSTTATVVMFRKENALYQACSQTGQDGKGCNKKVQDLGNGSYRCERCSCEMDRFNWRLILSFNVADSTDNQWVQCFQDEAEKIVGVSAQELGDMQEENPDQYNKAFQNATFQKFNLRLRCKSDNYNDEQRVRHTVMNTSKVSNWAEYNKRLIKEIKEMGGEIPADVDESLYA